jgi:polysaccharide pyruvyl transferase WcaK-like protein
MRRIVIASVWDTRNNGSLAMAQTVMAEMLRTGEVRFTMHANHSSGDRERLKDYPVDFVERPWTRWPFRRGMGLYAICSLCFFLLLSATFRSGRLRSHCPAFLRTLFDAERVIDVGGDILTEDYGAVSLAEVLLGHELVLRSGVPLVILAQTIGPVRSPFFVRWLRSVLSRAAVVTVRDPISYRFLDEDLGVRDAATLTADLAFLLPAASDERAERILLENGIPSGSPLAGISASQIVSRYFRHWSDAKAAREAYLSAMASTADHLVETLGGTVIFVPHVTIPGNDDRLASREIRERMEHREKAFVLEREYLPGDYKSVISRCSVFVGARMHATIAALSTGVPTLVMAYSAKTLGIMGEMLGQREAVLDVRDLKKGDDLAGLLAAKTDALLAKRAQLRESLLRSASQCGAIAGTNFTLMEEKLRKRPAFSAAYGPRETC